MRIAVNYKENTSVNKRNTGVNNRLIETVQAGSYFHSVGCTQSLTLSAHLCHFSTKIPHFKIKALQCSQGYYFELEFFAKCSSDAGCRVVEKMVGSSLGTNVGEIVGFPVGSLHS